MSDFRRRLLMVAATAVDESRVEYIENNTLGEYINTGFVPNANSRMVIEVKDFLHTSNVLVGSRIAALNSMFAIGSHTSGTTRFDYATKSYTYSGGLGNHKLELNKNVAKIDGTTIATLSSGTVSSSLPIHVFGLNNGGNHVDMLKKVKVVSMQIYDNGTLVRDYVAYRVGTVGYLKDLLTGTLYPNAGTGNFTFGSDI